LQCSLKNINITFFKLQKMPVCQNCNQKFPTWIKIDGKSRNLSTRKYCLECTPFKSFNRLNLSQVREGCSVCQKQLTGSQRKYCSIQCKHIALNYQKQKAKGLERKKLLVTQKGGCCSICGYNKNLAAMHFHHLEPGLKEFKLSLRELGNHSEAKINAELKKCILVCSNCHAEIHHPQLTLN
jgi:hypothetical protein